AVQYRDCLLELGESLAAALGQSRCAQGSAKSARRAPDPGELELFSGEPARLVLLSQFEQHKRYLRTPGHERRVAPADVLETTAGVVRLLQAARHVPGQQPDPSASEVEVVEQRAV